MYPAFVAQETSRATCLHVATRGGPLVKWTVRRSPLPGFEHHSVLSMNRPSGGTRTGSSTVQGSRRRMRIGVRPDGCRRSKTSASGDSRVPVRTYP